MDNMCEFGLGLAGLGLGLAGLELVLGLGAGWLTLYIGDPSSDCSDLQKLRKSTSFKATILYWVNTHFKSFVELNSLLINVERFGFCKLV